MPILPVVTRTRLGETTVHLHQVVREVDESGETIDEWVVVGFTAGGVRLASPEFNWGRTVPDADFETGYRPLVAGEVPVWGY